MLAGAGADLLKAAPAASFWQAKKESLVLVTNMTLVQFIKVNMIQKRLALIIHFLRAKNVNFSVLSRAGAAFFLSVFQLPGKKQLICVK